MKSYNSFRLEGNELVSICKPHSTPLLKLPPNPLRCVCTRDEVPTRQLPVNVPSFRSISSAAAILSSALDLPRHRSLIRRQGSSPRGAGRSIRCPAALAFSLLAIPKKVVLSLCSLSTLQLLANLFPCFSSSSILVSKLCVPIGLHESRVRLCSNL